MADVFLSYKSDDRATVQLLAGALRDQGFSVWFDEGLGGDESYHQQISDELGKAAVVVAVWSARAEDSRWVYSEANEADKLEKLLNIRLDAMPPPKPFDRRNALDFEGWVGDHTDRSFKRLVEDIRRVLARSAGAEQSPRSPPIDAAAARAWILIQDDLRPEIYLTFVERYPVEPQAVFARQHLEQLQAWETLISEMAQRSYKIGDHIRFDRIGLDTNDVIRRLDDFILTGPFIKLGEVAKDAREKLRRGGTFALTGTLGVQT